jgi:hypothetical protein
VHRRGGAVTNPTGIGRPRAILETVWYGGTPIRCPHCRGLADRLLVVDDGDPSGPALACEPCVARAGGTQRATGAAQ